MKIVRIAALMAALAAAPASADPARDAAQSVIQSQLDAFQAADVQTAFSFAAPSIQEIFRSPDAFGRMVRRGFPMVWAPSSTEFLEAEATPSGLTQRLRIIDLRGQPWIAEYQMVEVDGAWRIAAVRVLEDPGFAV